MPPDAANGRFAAKIITRPGTEQVTRFAAELALSRGGKLTVSAKTNMLPATDRWFCDIAREVAQEYPGLEYEQFIIDDMAHRLVVRPHELDVLLLPNLYGDILSDQGAGTIGGMGLAPSGCYGDDWAYFESAHGTAPDIAGQGIINPTATLESAEMMLRHLGLDAPGASAGPVAGRRVRSGRAPDPRPRRHCAHRGLRHRRRRRAVGSLINNLYKPSSTNFRLADAAIGNQPLKSRG